MSTPDEAPSLALVRLLQLASAASPVGSFAWSEGLEHAVHAGDVHDEASARAWIGGLLEHSVAELDLPALVRMHAAFRAGDRATALERSAWLLACRETAELRLGDRQQGRALARVVAELGVPGADALGGDARTTYAGAFAHATAHLGVDAARAAAAYAFAWVENAVLAAIKLVPLGQGAGQRTVFALAGRIPALCEGIEERDLDDVAPGAPGLAITSARHETLETRLFRS